jgi:WD40 repeat protein
MVRVWKVSAPRRRPWTSPPGLWPAVSTAFGHDGQKLYLLAVTREKPNEPSGPSRVPAWSVSAEGRLTEVGSFLYEAPFTAAVFSPHCKRVVAYTGDGPQGVAVVWEVETKTHASLKRKSSEVAHDEAISSAVFREDGEQLITTSKDDTAIVWSWPEWSGEKLQGRQGLVIERVTPRTFRLPRSTGPDTGSLLLPAG